METVLNKNMASRPLVVDLDGTLVKTDILFECASNLLIHDPLRFFAILACLVKGRSYLKTQLADATSIDIPRLPYNSGLLSYLKQQKESGRKIVLATASPRVLADAISNHLGLFDEVLASEGDVNLKSEAKKARLVELYGEQGYDYIGNSRDDLPVWTSACKAYVVSSSAGLIKKVKALGNLNEILPTERRSMPVALFKALRPHQWVKNLLLFMPALAAHKFGSFDNMIHLIIAFGVFCLAASSVYLLNDLVDVADDRYHHRKKRRPFAAGDLSLLLGWLLWPVMMAVACTVALLILPEFFFIVLLAYFILTIAYSFRLKQLAILDVITLAMLYTLRIIAGAVAIYTSLSLWMLAFSMFLFLSLAFIKRFSELKLAREAGRETQIKGRGYIHKDLEIISSMGVGSGYLSVLVLALYIQDYRTVELYPSPHFILLACPLLLYWISRAWLLADRGQMHDDPIIFAIKDKVSWAVAACFVGAFCLAMVHR